MRRSHFLIAQLLVLAAAAWAFAPGLHGGFLFDDYVNLPALGEYGGVHNWSTLALYLTSGLGDPIGRPLSLLTFLIDARTWPAASEPFLRTNILLHLLNGVLLSVLMLRLHRAAGGSGDGRAVALLGSCIWLLHPIQLSTVLYIVQREAMLATTFVMLAFLAWLHGREAWIARKKKTVGVVWLIVGAWACTALAALAKANGLLTPLLLLVAEHTLLRDSIQSRERSFVWVRRSLLGLPILILIVGLLVAMPTFVQTANDVRPWTLGERLLTEPRVLFDYIRLLVLPRPISHGVFHDDFAASLGILDPPTTLVALVAILSLLVFAWMSRVRWPVFAFSVLFFATAHALESTFIPLELYFEHRNYLPSLFVFWPLSFWLKRSGSFALPRIVGAAAILCLLCFDARIGALTWGNPSRLAMAWADRNPVSPRAQAYAAQFEIALGAIDAAQSRLRQAIKLHPHEPQLTFNLLDAECANGALNFDSVSEAETAIRYNPAAAALDFNWLSEAIPKARENQCRGLDLSIIERLLRAAEQNSNFARAPGRLQDFAHLQGLVDLNKGEIDKALTDFESAVDALPTLSLALEQASLLGDAGRADLGLQHLDRFVANHPLPKTRIHLSSASLHEWLLGRMNFWQDETARVRSLLQQATASSGSVPQL